MWIKEAVTAFVGVDKKTYGPFAVGAYATIPKEDATRLVGEGLASYTPPIAPELVTMLEEFRSSIEDLKGSVETMSAPISGIQSEIEALRGQTSMLATAAAVEGIAVVVLAAVLALMARRKPSA